MAPGHMSWKPSVTLNNGRWADSPGLHEGPRGSRLPGGPPAPVHGSCPLCHRVSWNAQGSLPKRKKDEEPGGSLVSLISPLPCAVSSVQEAVSDGPDVASGTTW